MQIDQVFNQLKQAYLLIDESNWRLVAANPAACSLLEISQEDLSESSLWVQTFLPVLQNRKNEPSLALTISAKQRLQAHCSSIADGESAFLAVHLTPDKPSELELHDFYSMLDNLGAYVYSKDCSYNYTYANQQVCDLFGHPLEQVVGNNDCKFFGKETGEKLVAESDRYVIEQGQTLEKEEINYIPYCDEYRTYLTVKKPLYDSNGLINGLFGISTDITELKRIQKDLRDSQQKLTTILDNVGAYIYIKDKDRRFQYINKVTEDLFQRSSEEVVGLNNYDLLGPEQGEEFDRTDRQVFESGKQLSCIEAFHTEEETYFYWSVKIPLTNDQGEIDSYIGMSTDITEQKRLENQVREANLELNHSIKELTRLKEVLHEQATRDPLTGLYNRRFLEEHVDLVLSNRDLTETSVLMIDADNFKKINDLLGHKTGDDILRLLAGVMSEVCRASDLVCRYGGEEFLILLPDTPASSAFHKAEEIRSHYEQALSKHFPAIKDYSISIGVATAPQDGDSFDELCQAADKALYKAKDAGRGCCRAASEL